VERGEAASSAVSGAVATLRAGTGWSGTRVAYRNAPAAVAAIRMLNVRANVLGIPLIVNHCLTSI
jgi:hypothetical protein